MAEIDVLIPAYNAERTIRASIQSILDQTFRDIRVVVVDDGSTDRTGHILDELAASDPRLFIVHQSNGGIVDAMNAGLDHCISEFVARHDADDIAFPNRLDTQINYMRSNAECVAVSSNAYIINNYGDRSGVVTDHGSVDSADPSFLPPREPYLMHPFLMIRRRALEDVGRYRHVFHAEDADLYWRVQRYGKLVNIVDTLGEYRIHPNSVTSKSILNGRVNAINSQLAATSELRRRSGRQDIEFKKSALESYHAARSLERMVQIGSANLTPDERVDLEVGASLKLLEMALYRPYRLEISDCVFIKRAITQNSNRSRDAMKYAASLHLYMCALLLRRGQLSCLVSLATLDMYPKLVLHFLKSKIAQSSFRS